MPGTNTTTTPGTEPAAHAACPRPARPRPHRRSYSTSVTARALWAVRGLPGPGPVAGRGAWPACRPGRGCPRPVRPRPHRRRVTRQQWSPDYDPVRGLPVRGSIAGRITPSSVRMLVLSAACLGRGPSFHPVHGPLGRGSIAGESSRSDSQIAGISVVCLGPRLHGRYRQPEGVSVELPLYVACLTTALSKELEGGPCVTAGEELSVACPCGPIAASRSFSRTSGLRPLSAACPAAALSQDRQAAPLPTRRRRLSAACQAAAPSQVVSRHGRFRLLPHFPWPFRLWPHRRSIGYMPSVRLRICLRLTRPRPHRRHPLEVCGTTRPVLSAACQVVAPSQEDAVKRHRPVRQLSAACQAAAPSLNGASVDNQFQPVRSLKGRGPIAGTRPAGPAPACRRLSVACPAAAPSQLVEQSLEDDRVGLFAACQAASPSQDWHSAYVLAAGGPVRGLRSRGPIAGPSRPHPTRFGPGLSAVCQAAAPSQDAGRRLRQRTGRHCPRPARPRPHRRRCEDFVYARLAEPSAACQAAAPSQGLKRAEADAPGRQLSAVCQAGVPSQVPRRSCRRPGRPSVRGLPGRGPIAGATSRRPSGPTWSAVRGLSGHGSIAARFADGCGRRIRRLSVACRIAAPSQGHGRDVPQYQPRLSVVWPAAAPSQVGDRQSVCAGSAVVRGGPIADRSPARRCSAHIHLPAFSPSAPIAGRTACPRPYARKTVRGLPGRGPIAGRYRPTDRAVHSAVRGLPGRGPIAGVPMCSARRIRPNCPWPARPRPHRRMVAMLQNLAQAHLSVACRPWPHRRIA